MSWKVLPSIELTDMLERLSPLNSNEQQLKSNDVELKLSKNAAQVRVLDQYSDLIEAEPSLNFELLTHKV